jgi:hypothetical protein
MKPMQHLFKRLSYGIVFLLCTFTNLQAQKTLASPRDSASATISGAHLSINYGSPSVKGRQIWGKLLPYGQVWRAGANEATRFKTDKPITIQGKTLAAGEYGFFVIPTDGQWTIIFNKVSKQWGAYEYAQKDDVLRVSVTPIKQSELQERLLYTFTEGQVNLIWEHLQVPIKITAAK